MKLHKALVISKAAGKFAGVSLQSVPSTTGVLPPGHVRIQMKAARINPVDMDLAGGLPFGKKLEPNHVVGVDGTGYITEMAGDKVKADFKVGDHVFLYRSFTDFGTWTQEMCVDSKYVAKAPKALSLQDCGAIALTAPTAYDSLFHQLKITDADSINDNKQKSILILGAGGGVGFAAVQFAVHAGLRVVAYAGTRDFDKLTAAGVAQCINYKTQELVLVLQPGDVDYIFDAAGQASLSQLMRELEPTKVCSVKHPNPDVMDGVGIELNWFWKLLFQLMAYKDNRVAKNLGVELIGQVTPSDGALLKDVATRIDGMGDSFQTNVYKTLPFSELEANGGTLSEKDLGKVLIFDE